MAAYVRTITLRDFRRLDSLSGEMRVVGGSRLRRGVRRLGRRASCKSPEALAGSDAACGAAAGGSAHTSAAHAASRETDAEPAKPKAGKAERAPEKEEGKTEHKKPTGKGSRKKGGGDGGDGEDKKDKPIESLWDERVHLDGGEDLPADGAGFVDAVNEYVDLVRLTDSLLRERDEKSSKSLLEKLLEMKYGKGMKAETGGVRPIICDLPGPIRD